MLEILKVIILSCTINTGDKDSSVLLKEKRHCIKETIICMEANKSPIDVGDMREIRGLKKCLTQ